MTLDQIIASVTRSTGFRQLASMKQVLVPQAEAVIFGLLRTPRNATKADITLTGGEAPLPADFDSVVGVFDGDEALQHVSLEDIFAEKEGYAIHDGKLYVNPPRNQTLRLVYHAKIPSALNGDNIVIKKYPQLYSYALTYAAYEQMGKKAEALEYLNLLGIAAAHATVRDYSESWAGGREWQLKGATP